MVVHGHRYNFFGALLADDVLVQFVFDDARAGNVREQRFRGAAAAFFLINDGLAELDALAADVHFAGPLDEGSNIAEALLAKRTVGVAIPPRGSIGSLTGPARTGILVAHAFVLVCVHPGLFLIPTGTQIF